MSPEQLDCPVTRELRNRIFSELALELPPLEFEILRDLYLRYTTPVQHEKI